VARSKDTRRERQACNTLLLTARLFPFVSAKLIIVRSFFTILAVIFTNTMTVA
jgi:hypothetical protein